MTTPLKTTPCVLVLFLFFVVASIVRADTECRGWGDVRALRINGDAFGLTTNLRMTNPDESENVTLTSQARNARGTRAGNAQTFTGPLAFASGAGINWRIQITDTASDTASFDLTATANADLTLGGVYYWFNLPAGDWLNGTAEITTQNASTKINLTDAGLPELRWTVGTSIKLTRGTRSLELTFPAATNLLLQATRRQNQGGEGGEGRGGEQPPTLTNFNIAFPLGTGNLARGQNFHAAVIAKAAMENDYAPIHITLDPAKTGPAFAGIGGNFRLQSQADPAHIAYNLENLRIAWGRVAMPLNLWQTSATMDAAAAAEAGQLNNQVRLAMEMARTLAQKKIPIIISDWSAPAWAVDAPPAPARGPGGGGGVAAKHIADDQWPAMYKGIVSYLVCLKKNYGAEPELFSFNESDLGIDVHLTPEDQHLLIRELGAAMQAAGLKTKMLLGDTSSPSPRPNTFMDPTLADPDAMKFVGAMAYHSWNGGTDQQLALWGQAAQRTHLPLLVSEGGTDPDSYRFPNLFLEPWYSIDEINLYLRCCALSQPASILHWQLTENYSPLASAGRGAPLQPTQRFFNLKQLDLTPSEAPWLAASVDRPHLTVAAYGDDMHGYAIHLINTGAAREVTLTGIPASIKELHQFVTDEHRHMQEIEKPLPVAAGMVKFTLDADVFVTLLAGADAGAKP